MQALYVFLSWTIKNDGSIVRDRVHIPTPYGSYYLTQRVPLYFRLGLSCLEGLYSAHRCNYIDIWDTLCPRLCPRSLFAFHTICARASFFSCNNVFNAKTESNKWSHTKQAGWHLHCQRPWRRRALKRRSQFTAALSKRWGFIWPSQVAHCTMN